MTIDALDPVSKIPEFKVCACRIEPGGTIDPVAPPPPPPGRSPTRYEQDTVANLRPPTAPQGRGTSER
jgi:assimilatory nitrate reductase catalytic subunit